VWAEPVTLHGDAVVLEPLAGEHRAQLAAAAGDPEVWRWMSLDGSRPELLARWLDDALEAARDGAELPFVTRDARTGDVLGSTRYLALAPEHRRLEIGHTWLVRRAWGTGANTETKLLLLEHAFESLGCRRVEFKTDARNERSRAALAALPARFEGVHRKHMLVRDGDSRDSAWYSVVDDEWPQVRRALRARLGAR
jgi:N-acetyltransferase